MNKETEKILSKFGNFDLTSGYRMIMLINREKNGKDRNESRSIRRVSKNSEEFIILLEEFLAQKKTKEFQNYRIYSCVNDRDINKAIRTFKKTQLDADYYDEENRNSFYTDIKNRWLSALMQPQSRKSHYFLLDIDTKDSDLIHKIELRLAVMTGNFFKYETKNGYHIVSNPFNTSLLPDVEIKKDGLLLLSY